jgi:hypothetical protein
MNKYIFEKKNSIPQILCEKIINLFDNEKNKSKGRTLGGVNVDIKDTTDIMIPKEKKWEDINSFLENELEKNLKLYIDKIDIIDNFKNSSLIPSSFMIQKYDQNKGKYEYHNDFAVDANTKMYRIITYLWYLNDVDLGGETDFLNGEIKVVPECGKLILFPASWTYPHKGCIPKSSNKYIITGWIYKSYNDIEI